MLVDVSAIRDGSTPPRFAGSSTVDKGKGRADPPVAPAVRPKRAAKKQPAAPASKQPAAPTQDKAVVEPKRRGRPPKAGKSLFFFEFYLILNLYSCF